MFPASKGGGGAREMCYPVVRGGCKKFRTRNFPIL